MPSTPRRDPFDVIDRLVCGAGLVPDAIATRADALQAVARGRGSSGPLSRAIVDALLARRGQRIALLTGFVRPDVIPCGENDGPLGAVALARALRRAGFLVVIHTDPQAVDHATWLAAEIGAAVPVEAIPANPAAELGGSIDVAIAIEKPGENIRGHLHAWSGQRIEAGSIPIDRLFVEMMASGRLTVAIGDRGNEVGFGRIHDELVLLVPEARRCTCGCGGGIAAITSADHLLPAAVSNWGAYGLCAGLALATSDRSLLLRPDEEARLLNVAAVRGYRDGLLGTAAFGVDGISGSASVRVVEALRAAVAAALERS